jgi:phosphatidate cytidylyltransferase
VLLPVALFCLWAGGFWFLALTVAAAIGLAAEWAALCGFSAAAWPGCLLPATLTLAAALAALGSPAAALVAILAGGLAVLATAPAPRSPLPPGEAMAGLGWLRAPGRALAFGFPYLGLAAIALPWLRDGAAGWPNTLFVLCVIWASDIGAYMVGRLVGGPKLATAISPGKTRSGAVGGLAASVLAGAAVAACFSTGISPSRLLASAIGLGILAQAGDLFESALKRHFGVKDSGRIIPGHGGLLDRLDALLAVAPVAAVLACTVGRGAFLWR